MYRTNPFIEAFLKRRQLSQEDVAYLMQPSPEHQHDPFGISGMSAFIDLLHAHKGEQIAIVPDYDADGVLSGTVASVGLSEFGFGVPYIHCPTLRQGYGLSVASVKSVLEACPEATVLLTTDNGSSAYDGVAYAKKMGMTVLVTDHHTTDKDPIADAIVNPNRTHIKQDYPYKSISGTAVIYKTLSAYASRYITDARKIEAFESTILLVGMSTVSDVMPMLDENRYFVTRAITLFERLIATHTPKRIGLYGDTPLEAYYRGLDLLVWTLNNERKLNYGISSMTFGFMVAPMLNAPRRMLGESAPAFALFNSRRADVLAPEPVIPSDELYRINVERKAYVAHLTASLHQHVEQSDRELYQQTVFTARMKTGVAGLLAGSFTSRYEYPAIAFSVFKGRETGDPINGKIPKSVKLMTGSARSPEWLNLYAMLKGIDAEHPGLIASWGGHPQAAGIKVLAENYETFKQVFTEKLAAHITALSHQRITLTPTRQAHRITTEFVFDTPALTSDRLHNDGATVLPPDNLVADATFRETLTFFDSVAPYGERFEAPTFSVAFYVRDAHVSFMGAEGQHVKLTLPNGLTVIDWNGRATFKLNEPDTLYVCEGSVGINEFRGRESVQFIANRMIDVT